MNDFLTSEEEIILSEFKSFIKQIELSNGITYGNLCEGTEGICFYKENNQWKSFVVERDQKFELPSFDSLYDFCINFFKNLLDKKKSEYCLYFFPLIVKELLGELKKRQK